MLYPITLLFVCGFNVLFGMRPPLDPNVFGYGIYKFSDGRIYLGQWMENSMHGFGEFLWEDGKKYVGYYVEDKKEGFGMYMWNSPLRIYVGFWSNGKQHGVGKYIAQNYSKWGIWEAGTRKKLLNYC